MWDRLHILKFLQANAIESRAQGDYAPSNRAIELLGRDQGMFGARSGQQSATPEPSESVENQAELAASWLEEMEEKLQITTVKELAAALRSTPVGSPGR